MAKLIPLKAGLAAFACLVSAGMADAATNVTEVATFTLQSYTTTTAKTALTFTFDATPNAYLNYSEYVGGLNGFDVGDFQVGPFAGQTSFTIPGVFNKSVTIAYQLVPQAPEPATWAMMMLGFGAIGMGIRAGTLRKPRTA